MADSAVHAIRVGRAAGHAHGNVCVSVALPSTASAGIPATEVPAAVS